MVATARVVKRNVGDRDGELRDFDTRATVSELERAGGRQVLADLLIDEEMPIKVHSHAAQLIPKVR